MIIRTINRNNETTDIIAHVLGKNKTWVFTHDDTELNPGQLKKIKTFIKKRRAGVPLAYLFGYKYFYGLKFKVTKDTLIPRPETELVIDKTLQLLIRHPERSEGSKYSGKRFFANAQNDEVVRILDVGTGSGCIAISLAKNLPKHRYQIYASDVSAKALAIAKQNARTHKSKIKFIKSDLLNNINQSFDLIIANLPYLDRNWKHASIKQEPKKALFADRKGLALIGKLLNQIAKRDHKPEYLILEFDPRQKNDLQKLILKYFPKSKINFYKDYANYWRAVVVKI